MSNNTLSLNEEEIERISFKLSYFLLDYYYNDCLKQFPHLINYPVSIFCVGEKDSSFDLSCMTNEDSKAFTRALDNIEYTLIDSKMIQKYIVFHLFQTDNYFPREYCNILTECLKNLDYIDNSDYIESKLYFQSKKNIIQSHIGYHLRLISNLNNI